MSLDNRHLSEQASLRGMAGLECRRRTIMKNTLMIMLAVATLAVSGVCLYQARQLQARKAEIAGLQRQVQTQADQLEAVKSSQERLKQRHLDIADKLEATSSALDSAQEAAARAASNAAVATASAKKAAASGKPGENFGPTIAKMLENPEMKKMIAAQQRAMMDMMYGPLFKELGLSPEETDRFKEMLLAVQMKGVEQAGSLFGGKADAKEKAELAKSLSDATKQSEDEIKAFLGDARYAQYEDYKETIGERMQLNQLTQQLASGQNALTADQQGQMLNIMKEERKAMANDFASLGWAGSQPSNPADALSEEKMNQIMDLQKNLGQRVYERARSVLQPEQLSAFGTFQSNQLSMQRLGIKMFQGMMGGGKEASGGAAQPGP
jgi:hypothetical protein